jgi:hypothetical protein
MTHQPLYKGSDPTGVEEFLLRQMDVIDEQGVVSISLENVKNPCSVVAIVQERIMQDTAALIGNLTGGERMLARAHVAHLLQINQTHVLRYTELLRKPTTNAFFNRPSLMKSQLRHVRQRYVLAKIMNFLLDESLQ